MNAPQIVFICFGVADLFLAIGRKGQPKTFQKYNPWEVVGDYLILTVILLWGGFFK